MDASKQYRKAQQKGDKWGISVISGNRLLVNESI
jgi:hypothetical protein